MGEGLWNGVYVRDKFCSFCERVGSGDMVQFAP